MLASLLAVVTLSIWLYLLAGRGWFWRLEESEPPALQRKTRAVAVVIPARDEADLIGPAIRSLFTQTYGGPLAVFVVDDHSEDGTAEAAWAAARQVREGAGLRVLRAPPLPVGWTGKLWAVECGLQAALTEKPDYVLLTDADIVHAPGAVEELVARAEAGGFDLVSWMVRLRCESLAERSLIPAFLYFFLKLYPPAWTSDLEAKTAGAAGGCILLRPGALRRIGGIASIRGELIDDCALARAVKAGGPIWMGTTSGSHSIRVYETFSEIERMIARTAFTQLRHSAVLLAGTILGLLVTYVAPPVLAIAGPGVIAHGAGAASWLLMMITYQPTLRLYRLSPLWALMLPLVALFYAWATVRSALNWWSGKGGQWKGRVQNQPL